MLQISCILSSIVNMVHNNLITNKTVSKLDSACFAYLSYDITIHVEAAISLHCLVLTL